MEYRKQHSAKIDVFSLQRSVSGSINRVVNAKTKKILSDYELRTS
jgi:hypothetical protein